MSWLIPSFLYVLMIGALGVTTKLATRHISWQADRHEWPPGDHDSGR